MKSPYSFPARSRAAMAAAIESIGHQRFYDHVRFPFCFNVKLDSGWNDSAATLNALDGAEWNLRPEWDSDWEEYAEENSEWTFSRVAESMWDSMVDSYSTYPGDDSGEWNFELRGRSSGWLCLIGGPRFDFYNRYLEDIVSKVRGDDPDERFTFAECRTLYRALVCMNQDFSRDRITAETRYQVAFIRAEWEAERAAKAKRDWLASVAARAESLSLLVELRREAPSPVVANVVRDRVAGRLRFGRQSRAAAWIAAGEVPLAELVA